MFSEHSLSAVGYVRTVSQSEALNSESIVIEDIVSFSQWDEILNGYACVIHLAGRAHVLSDSSKNNIEEFRKVNRDATLRLAKSASKADLKRRGVASPDSADAFVLTFASDAGTAMGGRAGSYMGKIKRNLVGVV